jgi:DNA-nicking Smr family endonuclease
MTDKKYDISADDREAFRRAMADVQMLPQDKIAPMIKRPPPRPLQREKDARQVLRDMMSDSLDPAELETGDELMYASEGLQPAILRKLRRGKYRIQGELDLHRMTSEQAREAIIAFIARNKASGRRCVRIIHGKGNGSYNKQPVLKGKLDRWLRQRNDVLAFCSARPMDGGTGAVYVLLAKR